jgi:hypothetical protein
MDELNKFEKTLLTHGYPIYCAIVLSCYALVVMSHIFFKN